MYFFLKFPRARARGLIEAFRRPGDFVDAGVFPRARARGLIEACEAVASLARCLYFREHVLAASLKLRAVEHRDSIGYPKTSVGFHANSECLL